MGNFVYHILGLSGTGPISAFWSGFGSDVSELAVFAGVAGMVRKHQCHKKWCWRFGHFQVDDIGTMKCRKHIGARQMTPALYERRG